MGANPTASGGLVQPLTVTNLHYRSRMANYDIKQVLWENVQKRMITLWGNENLTKLAKLSHVGPGTCTRIKEQSTSVGIDVLEKIAGVLTVQPWQLISPDMKDVKPFDKDIQALLKVYDRLPEAEKMAAAHTAMVTMINAEPDNSQSTHSPDQADPGEKPSVKPPSAPAKNNTH